MKFKIWLENLGFKEPNHQKREEFYRDVIAKFRDPELLKDTFYQGHYPDQTPVNSYVTSLLALSAPPAKILKKLEDQWSEAKRMADAEYQTWLKQRSQ
jgi:hypothetical protein